MIQSCAHFPTRARSARGGRDDRWNETPAPAQVQRRRANKQDVAALVHLRSLVFTMGADVGGQDAAWRLTATHWFLEQLARRDQFAGYVIEHPMDGVVSAALGSCDARAPGPGNVTGSHGRVFNISTDLAHRRRFREKLAEPEAFLVIGRTDANGYAVAMALAEPGR